MKRQRERVGRFIGHFLRLAERSGAVRPVQPLASRNTCLTARQTVQGLLRSVCVDGF